MALTQTPNSSRASFFEQCYALIAKVPRGRVTTYKEIAEALGTKAYRAVGQAMNKNPYAPKIPCHRVVGSDGTLGGFAHGAKAKTQLLKEEGVSVDAGRIVDFERRLYRFR